MARTSIGCYRGIYYRRQRICDVLGVDIKAQWYFTYVNGKATSDHFPTITALRIAIDRGEICDPITGKPVELARCLTRPT